ncbi:MAG TPA: SAM-dependent methyltransferase, partial [Stellaceae bacterium]|nr:SAM-dependent methyltransferase [Stellaceae bacterium]
VLRLKGGDPCVFGRGGEEALALAEAGIPFRIVPGITAAIGGLAYAGVPLTHRGINSAVTLITGHNSDGAVPGEEDSAPDWAALAKASPVIVLYMALRQLDDIARRLMAAGRAPGEPVVIVSKATTAAQRVVTTTLGEAGVAAAGVESPAIIAIGEVARLHLMLDWYKGE